MPMISPTNVNSSWTESGRVLRIRYLWLSWKPGPGCWGGPLGYTLGRSLPTSNRCERLSAMGADGGCLLRGRQRPDLDLAELDFGPLRLQGDPAPVSGAVEPVV